MAPPIYKRGVGRTSASTMPTIITMCAARPLHGASNIMVKIGADREWHH